MEKLVIVGNGIAGHSALQEVLKSGVDYDITMIYNEVPKTYMRTQLIKYALGKLPDEKFFMVDDKFYESNGVHSIKASVLHLDSAARSLTLSDGQSVPFDKLIISTGSYNFIPPVKAQGHSSLTQIDSKTVHDGDGVYTLRNLEDARSFGAKVPQAKRAIVVGGGLLGLEAAGELVEQGLDVTVVEFASRLLPRQMDSASSVLFQEQAEAFGLHFILGDSVETVLFEGDKVKRIKLVSGQELDTDLVLFSIGIRPNLDPFKDALATNRGILINEFTETSEPGIYACGDVSEYNGLVYGTWGFAMSTGKAAGQNAAGTKTPMKPYVLNTLFNALSTKVFSTGSVNFDDPTLENFVCGDPCKDYIKFLFQNNQLVAAVLMGDTRYGSQLAKAIDNHMTSSEAVATFATKEL